MNLQGESLPEGREGDFEEYKGRLGNIDGRETVVLYCSDAAVAPFYFYRKRSRIKLTMIR